jgi:hypothetical protein
MPAPGSPCLRTITMRTARRDARASGDPMFANDPKRTVELAAQLRPLVGNSDRRDLRQHSGPTANGDRSHGRAHWPPAADLMGADCLCSPAPRRVRVETGKYLDWVTLRDLLKHQTRPVTASRYRDLARDDQHRFCGWAGHGVHPGGPVARPRDRATRAGPSKLRNGNAAC